MEKQRTTISESKAMRGALHLYLEQLAHEANNMGLTMQDLIKVIHKLEVRPTKNNLKEIFVKPYIHSAYQLNSTEKMDATQVTETYDALNKLFGYHWHIELPFPSADHKNFDETYGG